MQRERERRLWATWSLALVLAWLLGQGVGLGAVGEEFLIGGPGWRPATAYDPINQRFLVLLSSGNEGQLLNASGASVGPRFPIDMCCETKVAADSVNGRYLVVAWQWNGDANQNDIFGQLVNADGTLRGARLPLATGANEQIGSTVAYDPINQRYLMAWHEYNGSDWDIFGQLVNADGTLFGASFPLAVGPNSQSDPTIAFDPTNQRHLVTWVENGLPWGRLVNTGGSLFGSPFRISPDCCASGYWQGVAHDAVNGRFLVAWGTGDIRGQLVNADGTLFGSVIPISQEPQGEGSPSVAYDPAGQRYLVAWEDNSTGNVHGRVVNADGTLPGLASPLTNAPNVQSQPAVACDTANGRFLVAWGDERDLNRTDVYGILLAGLPVMPMLSLQINTQSLRVGDPFRLRLRIQTPPQALPAGSWRFEVALWIKTPMAFPNDLISLLNLGGAQAVDLPPGIDQTFTLLDLPSFPGVPIGRYEVGGRLNHPVTRAELIWDVEHFDVIP